MSNEELIEHAQGAMNKAFAPYSKFKVGAALLAKDGTVYTGCNIENASYGACICAERVAFAKAISVGSTEFEKMAIVSSQKDFTYPCGICRQFMAEFGLGLKLIIKGKSEIREHELRELFRYAFTEFNSD